MAGRQAGMQACRRASRRHSLAALLRVPGAMCTWYPAERTVAWGMRPHAADSVRSAVAGLAPVRASLPC